MEKSQELAEFIYECLDIDDIDEDMREEYRQMSLFEMLDE